MIQVPENITDLLFALSSTQDDSFLEGFCDCLSYQYPKSSLSFFYDNYDFLDDSETFKESLIRFLDGGL